MKEAKTLGIFTGYFEDFFFFVCVGMILQPIECIICRSKKTAPGSSRYEDLTECTTNSGSEPLLLFAEESPDKYVEAQLLGLSVNDVLAKEFFTFDHVNVILPGHRKTEIIKNTKHVKNALKIS